MSWIDCKSKGKYNRLGYLVREDGAKELFRFSYFGESGLGSPEIIPGVETQNETITISTPSKLGFTLSSTMEIDGAKYSLSSIQSLDNPDRNGPFRGKAMTIKRIVAAKLV